MANKNVLVVESHNDNFFVERLIADMTSLRLQVSNPIFTIDEYKCLTDGLSKAELVRKLKELLTEIDKHLPDKIGIMVDADDEGIDAKLNLINAALKEAGFCATLPSVSTWVHDAEQGIHVSCYVLHVDGHGDLETLLRRIQLEGTLFADCLESWRQCLQKNGKEIKQKDFDKFWVSVYQRFDQCSKKERQQVERKCTDEVSMKKEPPIWNFEHAALAELKAYLGMFT
ncbi:DUF3226 domain-containing protein [Thiothrix subterranea]|uniref:DUF3226 domain-containing protein n=1 Tax=Thiothrix subterranea TaxID=2735563 RepID=A0AA51MLS2_9GAMM|nr:DUF3226 domain-containing protein [Thiothrix subterranea]MDQ5770914.1 DUF3226 domain-containing protein [Thiothrix subterranea]WML86742.1 DUF3226 domain-containing protein [Thiothrix subterranea]